MPTLSIDDDGYVFFKDKSDIGEVTWFLHERGWKAFLPGENEPCLSTWTATFPSDDDQAEAVALLEAKVGKKVGGEPLIPS